MIRNFLYLILLCEVAFCPIACCSWQEDTVCACGKGAAWHPLCPCCADDTAGKEPRPVAPARQHCSCICQGAILVGKTSYDPSEGHRFSGIAQLPDGRAGDEPATTESFCSVRDTMPTKLHGGRFVRILHCSWLC
jgi:hypothetical protein